MTHLTPIFKTLSDETRLRILLLLYYEALCVCEISGILEASQPKISKNLAKLRDLNLVQDVRRDKFVYYSLKSDNKILMMILKDIAANLDTHPQLAKDKERLTIKDTFLNVCQIINEGELK